MATRILPLLLLPTPTPHPAIPPATPLCSAALTVCAVFLTREQVRDVSGRPQYYILTILDELFKENHTMPYIR